MKRLLLVFIIYFPLQGVTVGPITDGEGIWNVITRIGQAENVIESKICALDLPTADVIVPSCDVIFGQDDVPLTISNPGTYCLKENIALGGSPIITIDSNDVHIDLMGHTIDCVNQYDNGININGSVDNTIIENGRIENADVGIESQTFNITFTINRLLIQDIDFANCYTAIDFRNSGNPLGRQFTIRRCNVQGRDYYYSDVGFYLHVADCVVQDCSFSNLSTGAMLLAIEDRILVENCKISDIYLGNGIVYGGDGYIFRNVLIQNVNFEAFVTGLVNPTDNVVFDGCIVVNSGSEGFSTESSSSTFHSNFLFRNCIAQHCNSDGFHFFGGGTHENITFENCIASSNAANGFHLEDVQHISFIDCVAQNNSTHGFFLSSNVNYVLFEKCLAQENTSNGFQLSSLNRYCNLFDCCALNNGGIGINNTSVFSEIGIFGNAAFENTGGDISGVTDGTLVVRRSTSGALLGTSGWSNAVS